MATDSKDFKVKNGLVVGEGGTFNGPVTVATPTSNTHATTKLYVDDLIAGIGAGGGSLTVSDTAPLLPSEGDLWYNSTDGSTYVYYDSFWVEASSAYAGPTGIVAANAPLSFDEATSTLSIDLSSYYTSSETDSAISAAVSDLVDTAPETLDTLNELAAALGDDANFASTVTNSLANKLEASDLAGYATETYVDTAVAGVTIDLSPYSTIQKDVTTQNSNYLVVESDVDSVIQMSPSSPIQVTLPADDIAISVGESLEIINTGTSSIDLVSGLGTLPWELQSLPSTSNLGDMRYLNGVWFVLGQRYIYTSTDTYTWNTIDVTGGSYSLFKDIDYDGSSYIMVGGSSSSFRAFQSTDGQSWTEISSLLINAGHDGSRVGAKIVYADNRWVVYSGGSNLYYSLDGGQSWSAGTLPSSVTSIFVNMLAYENGIWWLGASTRLAYSTDGETFVQPNQFAPGAQIDNRFVYGIAFGAGVWVAISSDGRILYSDNGIDNWVLVQVFSGTSDFRDVRYAGGKFYAVAFDGLVYESFDGISWTQVSLSATGTMWRVDFGGEFWLILELGSGGGVHRSGTVEAEIVSNRPSLIIPPNNTSAKILKRANNSWFVDISYSQSVEDGSAISSIMGVY